MRTPAASSTSVHALPVKAEQALSWLKEHPLDPPFGVPSDSSYVAIGERLRRGISDWRLSIVLQRVYYDLDEEPVEAIH